MITWPQRQNKAAERRRAVRAPPIEVIKEPIIEKTYSYTTSPDPMLLRKAVRGTMKSRRVTDTGNGHGHVIF